MSMTEPYPFPTSADEFADKRVLVTGGTQHRRSVTVRASSSGAAVLWRASVPSGEEVGRLVVSVRESFMIGSVGS